MLEGALEAGVEMVCLQEPFLGRDLHLFTHSAFQIYWPEVGKGEQKQIRVAIAVRKDVLNTFIWEDRSDLIQHTHIQAMDIWELNEKREKKRWTRVINTYDQNIQDGQGRRTRPIRQVEWKRVLQGRAILLGDFNAKSPHWDPYNKPRNAKDLEGLIERFNLILNNDTTVFTRVEGGKKSILDLTFSSLELGLLDSWAIAEGIQTPSDHKPIVIELGLAVEEKGPHLKGWRTDNLSQEQREKMEAEWWDKARQFPQQLLSNSEIEREVQWIQETVTDVLDKHTQPIRITPRSKRWWNKKVKESRKAFLRERRLHQSGWATWEELKDVQNAYYSTIRREKRLAWQRFLQGDEENEEEEEEEQGLGEKGGKGKDKSGVGRCWEALCYTKPRAHSTTPALVVEKADGTKREVVMIEEKEAVFLDQAFPSQKGEEEGQPQVQWQGVNTEHNLATREEVESALFTQSTKKAPGISRLNFKILRLL